MRRLVFVLAVLGTLGLVGKARGAVAPSGRERTVAESVKAVERLLAEGVQSASPGAAVMVLHRGEVVFQKGYGLADLEKKVPVTPTTTFELASVSKPFTALAILILMERGEIDLDDDIRLYVP